MVTGYGHKAQSIIIERITIVFLVKVIGTNTDRSYFTGTETVLIIAIVTSTVIPKQ